MYLSAGEDTGKGLEVESELSPELSELGAAVRRVTAQDQLPLCPDGRVQPQQSQRLRVVCRRSKMMPTEERERDAERFDWHSPDKPVWK